MTVTAIIAEDEERLRTHLVLQLNQVWPELNIVQECINGFEALQAINQHKPSVAFLDIKMPGLTGLEVVEQAIAKPRYVFVTAYDEFAVKAFQNEAVDYLLKPVEVTRLEATVARLKKQLSYASAGPDLAGLLKQLQGAVSSAPSFLRWIRASQGEVTHHLDVSQVLFFKSDDKYTVVQTAQGEFLIRRSVSELLAELDPSIFWQINRGVLINSSYLTTTQRSGLGGLNAFLRGVETPMPVAKPYQGQFKHM